MLALTCCHFVQNLVYFPSDHTSQGSPPTPDTTPPPTPTSPVKPLEAARVLQAKVRSAIPKLTPHENIYNLPNILTVSRLVAAPVTAYLLLHDQHKWALALFAYAGITDLVDGWIARRWGLQTVAGSVIDPMADKALMIVLTVTLAVKGALPRKSRLLSINKTSDSAPTYSTCPANTKCIRPVYLATLILGRDASLALAAIYYRYASLPHPKTFQRYWDFSLPSAEVHPTTVSKANTFLQLLLIGSTLALPVLTASAVQMDLGKVMVGFQWLVAGTTIWSGASYAFLREAVKILGEDEGLKARQGRRGRAIIGVAFGAVVVAALGLAVRGARDDDDGGQEEGEREAELKSE